ncbi:MAG: VOC family protein [Gammaproteobacteria bacterium]|nr:VOC family protein [Gammaproteobacteria bacterium]MYD81620.1 VOC family protein [Gammaproteobacteria bacterium]
MADAPSVIVSPLLWVDDIAKSVDFYERLGFSVSETWTPEGKLMWCSMKLDQAEIMLQQSTNEESESFHSRTRQEIELYFICDDVDSLHISFESNGLKASTPRTAFYPMKQTFLKDPDGRTICFETLVSRS